MNVKNYLLLGLVSTGLMAGFASCKDDENKDDAEFDYEAANLSVTTENQEGWMTYASVVSGLLKTDATNLYNAWTKDYDGKGAYADLFKETPARADYKTALECVEQIIDGCSEIAGEVGESKIGDPYDKYTSGKTVEALYAVESWYSWHSRVDYSNNILSILNAYTGTIHSDLSEKSEISVNDVKAAESSLYTLVANNNRDLNDQVVNAIVEAFNAIMAIPQPFRNNINSDEAKTAMEACAALDDVLVKNSNNLKSYIQNGNFVESDLKAIVANFVDNVVLPTYKLLQERNVALNDAITALKNNVTDENFQAAANAWLLARQPWEMSEAFLFGPVDALGLDPNMDSWPLDQSGIVNIIKTGKLSALNWNDGDSDDAIEAAQNLRGFHTLEYLIFKDGVPRTAPQTTVE